MTIKSSIFGFALVLYILVVRLPGCWLKKGSNEIVIFEQKNDKLQTNVKAIETPILEDLKPEKGEAK